MTERPPSFRTALGAPARRLVAGATDRRFDAVEAELSRILSRLDGLEQVATRTETEVAALRQQADEALAFLRVQHDIVRDLLEELRPVLERRTGAIDGWQAPAARPRTSPPKPGGW